MPNFAYNFLGAGGMGAGVCAAGPAGTLPGLPAPIFLTAAQLINAQLRLGVYPVGWVGDELAWRTYCLTITIMPLAAAGGVPGMPAMGVGGPAGVAAAPVAAGGPANLPPSPVATGVDATEKGQLGYHMGTAVGGSLIEYLGLPGALAAATRWFPFHLSRALANGGAFNYATAQRPDVVIYAVTPATLFVHRFVVWENKGHCINFGGLAAIGPALLQAQSLTNMVVIPGNPALGVVGGTPCAPWAPDCHVASQVDLTGVGGNFRVQVVDPPGPPSRSVQLSKSGADGFLRGYYAPFVEAVRKGAAPRRYDGRSFLTISLPKQVRFGLDEEIYRAWQKGGASFAADVARILSGSYKNSKPDTVHIHATGISTEVPLNWPPGPSS